MSTVDRHPAGTPSWFDVMTDDLEGARKFYGSVFGWDFRVGSEETGRYTTCTKNGKAAAGIGKRPPDAPYPSCWTVYFATDDAAASAARVKELGGKIMMGPMQVFDAGHMLIAFDPTGAPFGFWQPGTHKGSEIVGEPGAQAWCEVNTRDGAKARDFYAKLLGLEAKVMEMPQAKYWTLNYDERPVAGVLQMNERWPAEVPPHWLPYLAVDDTDAAVRRITKGGGKIFVQPVDTPHGRIAVADDPWGAGFSIVKIPG